MHTHRHTPEKFPYSETKIDKEKLANGTKAEIGICMYMEYIHILKFTYMCNVDI